MSVWPLALCRTEYFLLRAEVPSVSPLFNITHPCQQGKQKRNMAAFEFDKCMIFPPKNYWFSSIFNPSVGLDIPSESSLPRSAEEQTQKSQSRWLQSSWKLNSEDFLELSNIPLGIPYCITSHPKYHIKPNITLSDSKGGQLGPCVSNVTLFGPNRYIYC